MELPNIDNYKDKDEYIMALLTHISFLQGQVKTQQEIIKILAPKIEKDIKGSVYGNAKG